MKKIFLIGLPGSGKSTLGRQLAAHLRVPFVDLDREIEKKEAQLIPDLFKAKGEDYFRKREAEILKVFCETPDAFVMATGGGAPCFFDNMLVMKSAGPVVFLDVPTKIIAQRLTRTDLTKRPLFAHLTPDAMKDQVEFMRTQRISFYRQATVTVAGEMTAAEIANLI